MSNSPSQNCSLKISFSRKSLNFVTPAQDNYKTINLFHLLLMICYDARVIMRQADHVFSDCTLNTLSQFQ